MNDNSKQLLKEVLSQHRQARAPELSEQDYFEIFCAEQILKDFELSDAELQDGIVDGEHDGGIDAIYAFVNRELVTEEFDAERFKGPIQIELHIIQSKTSRGFNEDTVNRLISASRRLLSLEASYEHLTQYNDDVKRCLDRFRRIFRQLAPRFPLFKLRYHYASKGGPATVHPNLVSKGQELEEVARGLFVDADVKMCFLGARCLLELARKRPQTSYSLTVKKHLSDADGYVVLTPISQFARFLRNSDGGIRGDLFESNVRDFQGNTEVNKEIENTLKRERVIDFWWMNNGVTIVATRAMIRGDTITIENPKIVNGLQTSKQIANHFESDEAERSLMVKILESNDDETRDKIIKATNSQNPIQSASLRATDKVQRDIEDTLKTVNLYYDRRKNFYKNQGKPRDRIIGIPLMAQAVMSIILGKPDAARARPSSLIKKDSDYSSVFSEEFPLSLYKNAACLILRVQLALRARSDMTARDRTNLRFYVLYWVSATATGRVKPTAEQFASVDLGAIGDDSIQHAVDTVWPLYIELGGDEEVAKGANLRIRLCDEMMQSLESED